MRQGNDMQQTGKYEKRERSGWTQADVFICRCRCPAEVLVGECILSPQCIKKQTQSVASHQNQTWPQMLLYYRSSCRASEEGLELKSQSVTMQSCFCPTFQALMLDLIPNKTDTLFAISSNQDSSLCSSDHIMTDTQFSFETEVLL